MLECLASILSNILTLTATGAPELANASPINLPLAPYLILNSEIKVATCCLDK